MNFSLKQSVFFEVGDRKTPCHFSICSTDLRSNPQVWGCLAQRFPRVEANQPAHLSSKTFAVFPTSPPFHMKTPGFLFNLLLLLLLLLWLLLLLLLLPFFSYVFFFATAQDTETFVILGSPAIFTRTDSCEEWDLAGWLLFFQVKIHGILFRVSMEVIVTTYIVSWRLFHTYLGDVFLQPTKI